MTPEAAREVNKTVADKRRQIDGRNKEKKLVPRSSQDLEQKEAEWDGKYEQATNDNRTGKETPCSSQPSAAMGGSRKAQASADLGQRLYAVY